MVQVTVVKDPFDEWERIEYPTFLAGTPIGVNAKEEEGHPSWHYAKIGTHEFFVPNYFVTDGKLTRDYNPTELECSVGDVLEVLERHTVWLLARKPDGETGWIMAENVTA